MEDKIQEIQIPLKPLKEEKKWIRSSYNWGGATVLIQFGIINIVAIIVVFVAAVVVGISSGIDEAAINEFMGSLTDMSFTLILANLIAGGIAYPLTFFIACKGMKIKGRNFFSTKGFSAKFVLMAVVVALAAQLFGSTLASIITELFKQFGINLITLDTSTKPDMVTNILMYILACVFAPVFEEMIFRGIILKAFSKISIRFGIVVSAALFGLYHQNIPQAINAFFIGLVFGYVAYKAGSIIPVIIMHFALNANAMIWEAINYYFSEYPDYISLANIISAMLIIGGTIAICIIFRKKFILPKNTAEKKKRTLPIFITSWSSVLAIVIFILSTIFTSIQLN